jgi:hypothetical protein
MYKFQQTLAAIDLGHHPKGALTMQYNQQAITSELAKSIKIEADLNT